ncbi:hypothetical protein LXA43DRAFT_1036660 [Ganoderma leucocontextum]|nr:hypothetical protein LXA43DRAFT_1036660 [Ganoderma leucocontextum]
MILLTFIGPADLAGLPHRRPSATTATRDRGKRQTRYSSLHACCTGTKTWGRRLRLDRRPGAYCRFPKQCEVLYLPAALRHVPNIPPIRYRRSARVSSAHMGQLWRMHEPNRETSRAAWIEYKLVVGADDKRVFLHHQWSILGTQNVHAWWRRYLHSTVCGISAVPLMRESGEEVFALVAVGLRVGGGEDCGGTVWEDHQQECEHNIGI